MNKKECCLSTLICLMSTICLLSGIFTLCFGVAAQAALLGSDSLVQLAIGSSAIVWIAVGVITIFISIFGCCSVCCTSRGMLATYGTVFLLLSMTEIYIGIALESSLGSLATQGSSTQEIFILMFCICFGTAIIELIGAIVGLVAAHQFQPKYVRFDQMQQPLVITSSNYFPHPAADPEADK